jgi:hypothetical protein
MAAESMDSIAPTSTISESKTDATLQMAEDLIPGPQASMKRSDTGEWPRIALVTPVLNVANYIEQTIRSVLAQDYPNLEYVIVDGGSTDGTLEIIRRYEKWITWWVSETDQGMYDAINKGFARTSGEIMGWISGTDQLHLGALRVVGSVFRTFPQVEWITGQPTTLSGDGMTLGVGKLRRWSRIRFLAGTNRYIQQESTFWRRSLWEKAGGYVDSSRRMASDFELWTRFFRHAQLYPVNAVIAGYRMHFGDSLGLQDLERCHRLHDQIIEAELTSIRRGRLLKAFREIGAVSQRVPAIRFLWWKLVTNSLYNLPGPDWPPVIDYNNATQRWEMRQQNR